MDDARIARTLAPRGAREDRRREKRVRSDFWKTVRRAAGQIPFMDEVVAAYFCALDSRTPMRTKATLLAALAYFVMPIDVVPDFVAAFGFTDDMAVLMAAVTSVRAHITPAHRAAARDFLAEKA